jgi:8-oxo-dGTP pyrophosphatase MutT (NUDIX family)
VTIRATLCTIIKNGLILLQWKSPGRFGEGKWNGVGGKIKPEETPEECAKREVFEETNLYVLKLIPHGTIRHYFGKKNEPDWIVYHYSVKDFKGEPKGSDEGELRWFSFDDIPYEEMWQDDRYWLPFQIQGKSFQGEFYFNSNATELLHHDFRLEN